MILNLSKHDTFQTQSDSQRARREAEIWQRLKHPNVLPLLGVYESPRQFCFISPFMSNGSLSAYIRLHPEENRIRLVSHGFRFLHPNS